MFTFHQTYSFKCWNSSLASKSSSGPASCFVAHYIIRVSIGSKTLGMTLKYPLGPRGTCKDFLCFSCAKGAGTFCASFDGLGEVTMLKHHAALSWKVPECFRTIRLSPFKDLKFCLGARTSTWRCSGQSSQLRALNTEVS